MWNGERLEGMADGRKVDSEKGGGRGGTIVLHFQHHLCQHTFSEVFGWVLRECVQLFPGGVVKSVVCVGGTELTSNEVD